MFHNGFLSTKKVKSNSSIHHGANYRNRPMACRGNQFIIRGKALKHGTKYIGESNLKSYECPYECVLHLNKNKDDQASELVLRT